MEMIKVIRANEYKRLVLWLVLVMSGVVFVLLL